MADFLDWGAPSPELGFMTIGPQSDGTIGVPPAAMAVQPADVGSGVPASYSKDVIDVFKFGVGTWADVYKTQQGLDYKKYEVTAGGINQQGQMAVVGQGINALSRSITLALVLGVVAVVVLRS